ncbi:MAG: hypothetical protein OXG70_00005, partial [Cyanobacteria bacterium MAG IRC1_bin_28]|nr:hypothetical protein [Cyanobacteria bacterium MAG IRC1_bin_28]
QGSKLIGGLSALSGDPRLSKDTQAPILQDDVRLLAGRVLALKRQQANFGEYSRCFQPTRDSWCRKRSA